MPRPGSHFWCTLAGHFNNIGNQIQFEIYFLFEMGHPVSALSFEMGHPVSALYKTPM